MSELTHVFKVGMTCHGCENTMKNVLQKHVGKGINSFTTDLATCLVTVVGPISQEEALVILNKTGLTIEPQPPQQNS